MIEPYRWLPVLCALALTGCTPDRPPEPVIPPAKAAIELVSVTHDEWVERRSAFKPSVVVVDIWATWCQPCLERFPAMVELSKKYSGQGVQFVSLNVDDREDKPSIALAERFLNEQNARFPNFFLDENVIDALDKIGILGIPAVDVYDRDGNRSHRLTGDNPYKQFTEADVEAAIMESI